MATTDEILHATDAWQRATRATDPTEYVADSLSKCREAIAKLGSRLRRLGYPVSDPFTKCGHGLAGRVATLESAIRKPVPKIILAFWKAVGGASFIEFGGYPHCDFWYDKQVDGRRGYTDAFHVDACTDGWLRYQLETHEMSPRNYYVSIAPDGYHKDNMSGGAPYSVRFDSDWSPTLIHFSWSGHRKPDSADGNRPDFMQYIRTTILECAGFPGLLGDQTFESDRVKLVEGLPVF